MNRLEIEIVNVADAHYLVRANYPIRSEQSVVLERKRLASVIVHIYEGFETDTDQSPICSLTLGPDCPDDHEDGTTLVFEDGVFRGASVAPPASQD